MISLIVSFRRATGADLATARAQAYQILSSIRLPGSHFRNDIGLKAAEGKIGV